MAQVAGRNCNNCGSFDINAGLCRAAPPVPIVIVANGNSTVTWQWPTCKPTDWCDDWKQQQ